MVTKGQDMDAYEDGDDDDMSDRRKHRRVALPLKARFLNARNEERACLVTNVSAGGALMRTKFPPDHGEKIVVYIDQLGRFEGKVVRSGQNCFAVSYERKRTKNAKTADAITQALNAGQRATDRRKAPRVRQDAPAVVYLDDGEPRDCAILDISLTGASIEISPRPPLGAHLILGRMTAKVVRRHEKGVGVVFTGAAQRMDEVIEEASATEPAASFGPSVASSFGKKGVSA